MYDKPIVRDYRIDTDDIRNIGGKDMVLKRMVNHYSALSKMKPVIDMSRPHPHVNEGKKNGKLDIHYKQEFHNVREAYKKISKTKHWIDNSKPETYDMKPKGKYKSCKEEYDNIEHLRILEAMSKRILSFGKPHERRKNKEDPIANPTYFFRRPEGEKNQSTGKKNKKGKENEDITKLISLTTLNERLKKANEKGRNKMLLGKSIYGAIKNKGNMKRPKSSMTIKTKGFYKESGAPLYADMNPEEFIKMHQKTRKGNDTNVVNNCKKMMEDVLRKENEKKRKKLKGKAPCPVYGGDMDEFEEEIRNYIIENTIYEDEDFELLKIGTVKANAESEDISEYEINELIDKIKTSLDQEEL
ncbi:MAG: hypothetical protein MJ252_02650 [archaeon]|nr:hypothetical protein [archaeon]